jgi:hypothetical protein
MSKLISAGLLLAQQVDLVCQFKSSIVVVSISCAAYARMAKTASYVGMISLSRWESLIAEVTV